ncbi:MAG: metal-dependent transcriptional regulator [Gemmatimonadota bacterium]
MTARRSRRSGRAKSQRAKGEAPPSTGKALSGPVEDYLKAIYAIELDGSAAATNDIAARLEIAPASVSGMLRRLADQGLVSYERYRGVRLTDAGRRAALRTIRRHRVIEAYLAKALGYAWDRVHEEAERLEHASSDELIDRMAAAIGEPLTDPHGHPIPTRDGAIDERQHQTLSDIGAGQKVRIMRVSDDDPELLRYLAKLGIRPGVEVELAERAPFDGPLTLRVGRAGSVHVGLALASRLMVDVLNGPGSGALTNRSRPAH